MANLTSCNISELCIATYNCSGFKSSRTFINSFLTTTTCLILCLQETWLLDSNMDLLGNTHKDYFYTGVSGVDSKKDIIQGRPHGGVAILWHKSLNNKINVLITGNKRICAISVNISDKQSVLIITVYMPCDNRSHSPDEFIDVLSNVEQLLIQSSCNCVILCGDMNTSFARNNFHSTYLSQFMENVVLYNAWDHPNAKCDNTYVTSHVKMSPMLANLKSELMSYLERGCFQL